MITARPLVANDLDAFVRLLHAYDRRWFGEPVLSLEDVRGEWAAPDFDLTTDSEGWFDDDGDLEGPGALVAAGTLGTRGAVEVVVDDAWAGVGLEDALLERWETAARERRLAYTHRELPAADEDGLARLLARGWDLERTGWILRLEPGSPVAEGPLPPGYRLRAVTEEDLPEVHRVVAEAFLDYAPVSRAYEDWRAGLVDRPDVAVGHWTLALHGDEVVGACLLIDPAHPPEAAGAPDPPPGGEAWVPQVGVARAHRRQGLARELLARTVLAARGRGVGRVALYTHDGTGARGLYERLGFEVVHTLRTCRLAL